MTVAKRRQLGQNYHHGKVEFVTFAKIEEKAKGIGYHFIGIFVFDDFSDQKCKTMILKKIKDSYKLKAKS